MFDPLRRFSAADAIRNSAFLSHADFRDPEMEEDAKERFNFDFERTGPLGAKEYRVLISQECEKARKEQEQEVGGGGGGGDDYDGDGGAEKMKM